MQRCWEKSKVSRMKKAMSILIGALFVLITLYPAGVIATACFGYTFELINISAFAVAIAVLSVCIVILNFILKNTIEHNIIQALLTVITPLSLMNAAFYIFKHPQFEVIASILLSTGCCCYLTIKYLKSLSLKTVSLVLSVLTIFSIAFSSFIISIFGNIVQNTVTKTVVSSSGKYHAQIIDSDQGALGGGTFVDVYKIEINAVVFKINNKPQRVYSGDWGEFENMQLYWKDDTCLVINSVEYEIK